MENYFRDKNILITGGLGFLGSTLALRLVGFGAKVTVIDNLNPLYGGNIFNIMEASDKISLIINDIRNIEIMLPLIETADIVYHLAAQVSYIDSSNIPFEDLDLNARSTLSILECCKKINPRAHILFASSRMVYGKNDNEVLITESRPTNPLSLYGIHKLTSEKYLMMYHTNFGIPSTVLRLTNPYGPRQQIKHSKYSLVGWFIRQAMEGKTIQIFGDGLQRRDYIFVDDIIDSMLKCAKAPDAIGQIINVGSGEATKFHDMVRTVIECVKNGNIEFISWPENYEKVETGDVEIDVSKLRNITGWQPTWPLEEGVERTYAYYKQYSRYYI